MAGASFLSSQMQESPLLSQSYLNPKNGNLKKKVAGLMLTSLVDAFSILVIYLLFGPSMSGESISPKIGVNLPMAYQADLANQETTLVIKNKRYYIQETEVPLNQLVGTLKDITGKLKNSPNKALVIVADKENEIEQINPVLVAASQAGISQLRLAVEQMGD